MKSNQSKLLLSPLKGEMILKRFALQIVENHKNISELAIIGLQPRGIELAQSIHRYVSQLTETEILYGQLDHTFFRDDIGRGNIHIPKPSKINFSTEGKTIILVDDVLFTGRSVRSAIDAIMSFGRPNRIELLVLVDRIHERELPIKPDYVGVSIDSRNTNSYVNVEWINNELNVWLFENKINE
jgi:pyrimidine operon attenuation protein/uracil phosphoribosyltransferase